MALSSKVMADQLSSWLPKHSDELGILKMHHKMHPERQGTQATEAEFFGIPPV